VANFSLAGEAEAKATGGSFGFAQDDTSKGEAGFLFDLAGEGEGQQQIPCGDDKQEMQMQIQGQTTTKAKQLQRPEHYREVVCAGSSVVSS
jgi:hypothetical protein